MGKLQGPSHVMIIFYAVDGVRSTVWSIHVKVVQKAGSFPRASHGLVSAEETRPSQAPLSNHPAKVVSNIPCLRLCMRSERRGARDPRHAYPPRWDRIRTCFEPSELDIGIESMDHTQAHIQNLLFFSSEPERCLGQGRAEKSRAEQNRTEQGRCNGVSVVQSRDE
jgi:hypothetical protein